MATETVVGASCDWSDIPCHLSSFAEWLEKVLLYVPRKLWEQLLDALGAILHVLPCPDWCSAAAGSLGSITPGLHWAMNFLAIPEGVTWCAAAWLARWVLRRIPFIG